jgi:hypothetical protein
VIARLLCLDFALRSLIPPCPCSSSIDEKGAATLLAAVQTLSSGLGSLELSNINLSKKSVPALTTALKRNLHVSTTLTGVPPPFSLRNATIPWLTASPNAALDVSNNNLGPEGMASLSDWLAQPNALKKLNLGNTSMAIDSTVPRF